MVKTWRLKALNHLRLAYKSRKLKGRNTITVSMSVKHVIQTVLISMEYNNVFTKLLEEVKTGKHVPDMKLSSTKGNCTVSRLIVNFFS